MSLLKIPDIRLINGRWTSRLPPSRCWPGLMLLLILAGPFTPALSAEDKPESLVAAGTLASERGDFSTAMSSWEAAARLYRLRDNRRGEAEVLLQLGILAQRTGYQHRARQYADRALAAAERLQNKALLLKIKELLGVIHTFNRDPDAAEKFLTEALHLGEELHDRATVASIQNNQGNLAVSRRDYAAAKDHFRAAIEAARSSGQMLTAAGAEVNKARAAFYSGAREESLAGWDEAARALAALPANHERAHLLLSISRGYALLLKAGATPRERLLVAAHDLCRLALKDAEHLNDALIKSYALGFLAELYDQEGRPAEALPLVQQAIFSAQQTESPDALYRWEWLAARLHRRAGDLEAALHSYRAAARNLQRIRHDLMTALGDPGRPESFREAFGSLFLERADLLLQLADRAGDVQTRQPLLVEARESMELLKNAELEDYLQDACVNVALSKVSTIDQVGAGTAVIYVIALPDRTELLVSLSTGLERVKVPVGESQLSEAIHDLRRKLEKRTTHEYLLPARQVYQWLIAPLNGMLRSNRIDTLVFVPDGPLRLIPPAVLHDGEGFLVEQYAVAITPGLTLMDPKPLHDTPWHLLLNGISDAVQNFPSLPHVSDEINEVQERYGGSMLMNGEFRKPRLQKEMQEGTFSIVHIASHAQFGRDSHNPRETFLLTYDDKLTLDELEGLIKPRKFRGQPVELLTLSACQTASGDERAALGLAGVAFKAGARSALATLWFVNDEASASLVANFYQRLNGGATTKAKALQAAQKELISDPRHRHPCYWSPYLLIGNWL